MKITAIFIQSLDGIISRFEGDDLSWDIKADKVFYREKTKEIRTLIMGKTTYLAVHPKALKDRFTIVLTSKAKEFEEKENVKFANKTPLEVIEYLKQLNIDKAALIGGGTTFGLFAKACAIDEIYLTLAPKLFGKTGVKDFNVDNIDINLDLIETKDLGEGFLLLHYEVIKPGSQKFQEIKKRETQRKVIKEKFASK